MNTPHEWVRAGNDYIAVNDSGMVCGILRLLDDETHQRMVKRSQNERGVAISTARIKRNNDLRSAYRRKVKKT